MRWVLVVVGALTVVFGVMIAVVGVTSMASESASTPVVIFGLLWLLIGAVFVLAGALWRRNPGA